MTLKRLLPYAVIFLILAATYGGLRWGQERQEARDAQAKKVFQLQETDISDLSLIRGRSEVSLTQKDKIWYLTAPLYTKADQTIVGNMVATLTRLQKDRDLGEEKDLKPFGLDKPELVVKFTAQGQPRQLTVGTKVPGNQGYYALKDQDPHLLMISTGSKDSLDRQLLALRDKTLLSFITAEVKGLRLKSGMTTVSLEKADPQTWRWVERPDFPVRGDRVERLLRELHLARIKDFLEAPPKNLRAVGLASRGQTEVTVVTPAGDQTLVLGVKTGEAVYARKGADGPVVLTEAALPDTIAKTLASLEDRRLWSGALMEVHRVTWGPPGKTWTARKDQEGWKLSGPDQAATQQPAARLEMALHDFQKLEAVKVVPAGREPAAGAAFELELFDQAGNSLLRLGEGGALGKTLLQVDIRAGEKNFTALVPQAPFRQWQEEMQRLTTAAKPGGPAPATPAPK